MSAEKLILTALFALIFSLVAIPAACAIAVKCKLVDSPTIRKKHVGSIPLAGGIVLIS